MLGTVVGGEAAQKRFLSEAVQAEAGKLAKLRNMGSQHAFILLTRCMQQNLRHLLRTLHTEDLGELWREHTNNLNEAMHYIRGSERRMPSDPILFSIPAKLGGCGLLSFSDMAVHARAAMKSSSSNTLVEHGLRAEGETETVTLLQHTLCSVMFLQQRKELFEKLSEGERRVLLDNASFYGRKWMSAIPYRGVLNYTMSNKEVKVAIHNRTLCYQNVPICTKCWLPTHTIHDEICTKRSNWYTGRHDKVVNAIAQASKSIPGTTHVIEPRTPDTDNDHRTDLRLTGPGATHGQETEYDLTFVVTTAPAHMALPPRPPLPADQRPRTSIEQTRANLQVALEAKAAKKISKYRGKTVSTYFEPLVFSSGGTPLEETALIFNNWKKQMSPLAFTNLATYMSILNVRARAYRFEL